VWGLGHILLSSLSHASCFFNHLVEFHQVGLILTKDA
jgi:hypothetical protein